MTIPGHKLSRRERQILELFHTHGPMTARQIQERLDEAPSNSAIRTFLRILEEKGLLNHRKEGRVFVYEPTEDRGEAGSSAIQNVMKIFFDNSLHRTVAGLLDAHQHDPEELDELARLIEEARAGKGASS